MFNVNEKARRVLAAALDDAFRAGVAAGKNGEELSKKSPPCNMCGEPCGSEHDSSLGLIDFTVSGGFDSTPGNGCGALDDCTSYTFSLCEFCIDWLFTRFKAPPVVSQYAGGSDDDPPEAFRPAEQRVREDDWRRQKDKFFAEFHKRTIARDNR